MAMISQPLTLEQVRQAAPAAFATNASNRCSARYNFLPTDRVIETLAEQGFLIAGASQSKSRRENGPLYASHSVRFRHKDLWTPEKMEVDQEFPEIVLSNGHDGNSLYRMDYGIFRLVCKNGMVASSGQIESIAVRHSGNDDTRKRILDATYTISAGAKDVMQEIETWKAIPMSVEQQMGLAKIAVELKGNVNVPTDALLNARRPEDKANLDGSRSLWVAFNAIQENIIRGGVQYTTPKGRKVRTRSVSSVLADLSINRNLWQAAAEFAKSV